MSWTAPTTADLTASLSAAELADIGDRGADIGQDATAQIIARAAGTVRGYVRRTGVSMGPDGAIPADLLAACMDIAAVDVFLRLGIQPSQGRADRRRDALSALKDMAEGRGPAVAGYSDDAAASAHVRPSITPRDRSFGRQHSDGI